ncbi:MAG TPA: urea ABC transporter permease subunit UrtB [Alphaproteobacteria bacterium]|nr:urea ABC transporter permease subunit UrtB [Alphaproteobacteria bacterium]
MGRVRDSAARFLVAVLAAVALLLVVSRTAAADPFADLVARLGSESFADKEAAVAGLGALGDGRAIVVLQALSEGKLAVKGDGRRVVIAEQEGDHYKVTDAASGEALGTAKSADVDRVLVNNRLRGGIESALSGLQISSRDAQQRLAAARDAGKTATRRMAATLEKALASETVPEVKAAIAASLNVIKLRTGTPEERIKAIAGFADAMDPDVRSMLLDVAAAPDATPEVRAAAEAAAKRIGMKLKFVELGGNIVQGISLGSVLLLAAIGLAITFGLMGVINMAHGEMIMLGAYSAYVVQQAFRAFLPPGMFGYYLIVSIPVAFLAAGAMGVALERGIIRFLYGRPLETMLATWGISLILQQLVRSVFGAPNKEVSNPEWMTGGFELIGGFTVTWNRLYIVIFCFLILGALALMLKRTSYGLNIRAVTQNRDMASVMGIRVARVDALTFGLGSGIAGMAGVALSQIGNVSPNLGSLYIVDSFLVVVFGGVGSLMGTLVGAMGLGIANKFLEPFAGAILGKVLILVAIILFIQKRPRGLFALRGRAAES